MDVESAHATRRDHALYACGRDRIAGVRGERRQKHSSLDQRLHATSSTCRRRNINTHRRREVEGRGERGGEGRRQRGLAMDVLDNEMEFVNRVPPAPHAEPRACAKVAHVARVKLAALLHEEELAVGEAAHGAPIASADGLRAGSLHVSDDGALGGRVHCVVAPPIPPVKIEAGEGVDVAQRVERERRGHAASIIVRVVNDFGGLRGGMWRVDTHQEAITRNHVARDHQIELANLGIVVVAERRAEEEEDAPTAEGRGLWEALLKQPMHWPGLKRRRHPPDVAPSAARLHHPDDNIALERLEGNVDRHVKCTPRMWAQRLEEEQVLVTVARAQLDDHLKRRRVIVVGRRACDAISLCRQQRRLLGRRVIFWRLANLIVEPRTLVVVQEDLRDATGRALQGLDDGFGLSGVVQVV